MCVGKQRMMEMMMMEFLTASVTSLTDFITPLHSTLTATQNGQQFLANQNYARLSKPTSASMTQQ